MKTYIIAEAGVNHNGSVERALRMIDVAAESGADAVKFQTFKSESSISRHAAKANYQIATTGQEESQLEMVKRLELDLDAHRVLLHHCKDRAIQFLSTPFDLESVNLLSDILHVERLKIASGEITNFPLLLAAGRTGLPIILSTGMSTLGEVEDALGVLAFAYSDSVGHPSESGFRAAFASEKGRAKLQEKVALLHCTTEYPSPFDSVNLRAMDTLSVAFQLPVGLSDHTVGIAIASAAVARGATIIEKHFTLDRGLPGPDHKASLEPEELTALVSSIRQVEQSLGSPLKVPADAEVANRAIARKSLVAAEPIRKGDRFSPQNLTFKRPGTGVSPAHYWSYLGKQATRDYQPDELVEDFTAG